MTESITSIWAAMAMTLQYSDVVTYDTLAKEGEARSEVQIVGMLMAREFVVRMATDMDASLVQC